MKDEFDKQAHNEIMGEYIKELELLDFVAQLIHIREEGEKGLPGMWWLALREDLREKYRSMATREWSEWIKEEREARINRG
jgi:hypothetical protein